MNRKVFLMRLIGTIVVATAASAFAGTAAVTVSQGDLAGRSDATVTSFLGIPYAAPPVGPGRWRPPQPAPKREGVRAASSFGPSCRQALTPNGVAMWTPEYLTRGEISEDCLTLSVWTSAKKPGAQLPVLVWIHGGGFVTGSGSVPIYDGRNLASRGLVVVTVNYRLGVFGFLAHPALTAESGRDASGNYGLLDQVAALAWVRDNIAAFGGDPARVTIAGQSAGAQSVHALIASPLAQGLFIRAISQSGPRLHLDLPTLAQGEELGKQLSAAADTDLAGLRRMDAAQLEALVAKLPLEPMTGQRRSIGPIVDGYFYPDAAAPTANTNDVPVLAGRTADEMNGLDPTFGKATVVSWEQSVQRRYPGIATDLLAVYGVRTDQEANAAERSLRSEAGRAALLFWARRRSAESRQPSYLYSWNHVEPGPKSDVFGAFHSSDIPYVFDMLEASPARPFGPSDRALARRASSYWVNFVKTGNPNGPGLPRWPAVDATIPRLMEIGDEIEPAPILPDGAIRRFDRFAAGGGRLPAF